MRFLKPRRPPRHETQNYRQPRPRRERRAHPAERAGAPPRRVPASWTGRAPRWCCLHAASRWRALFVLSVRKQRFPCRACRGEGPGARWRPRATPAPLQVRVIAADWRLRRRRPPPQPAVFCPRTAGVRTLQTGVKSPRQTTVMGGGHERERARVVGRACLCARPQSPACWPARARSRAPAGALPACLRRGGSR